MDQESSIPDGVRMDSAICCTDGRRILRTIVVYICVDATAAPHLAGFPSAVGHRCGCMRLCRPIPELEEVRMKRTAPATS